MSNHNNQRNQNKLDAYLDGQLTPAELRAFETQLDDPSIADAIKGQARMDDSLKRLFQPNVPSLSDIEQQLATIEPATKSASETIRNRFPARRRRLVAAFAVAGAIAWMIVAFQLLRQDRSEPLFVSRPLTEIYQEAVAQGFEPYYECREPHRFAYTFEQRQGIPIHLDPMPAGSGMLGLSYSGGLSRNTTIMLCTVDEQPVMVFVDRLSVDQPGSAIVAATDALHVHREQRDGLVMYEVTPLERAHAMQYLRVEKLRK